MKVSRFQQSIGFWAAMALLAGAGIAFGHWSGFVAPIVGALVVGLLAMIAAATRTESTWTMFRRSRARLSNLSILWTSIASLTMGFAYWVSEVHGELVMARRGVPVFVGMLGLAGALSFGIILAELRPESGENGTVS